MMSNSLAVSPCANPFWRRERESLGRARYAVRVSSAQSDDAHVKDEPKAVSRRELVIGLAGAGGVASLDMAGRGGGDRAMAAARRPPPPPPEEKRDPNVSGVQAKVLASKRRKEAMKEAVAKLREKGKALE
ncbi:hypothetical protein MLD38_035696 [Melastoma candidum]|uniref:Uncharacterized protein n=1 Tax=Melastoma candidum TaxID=119954 RepID=A0ACB9LJ80_9MYRT|nr:hypothetical protein MLD38_035696 [Melastoma candidum]